MKKFFSIITATYNAATTLPRLLDSLACQTFRDFELIIQDGASADATIAVAEAYAHRLPALSIASEADRGIYDAWNRALGRIDGRWLLFLGADDSLYAQDTLANVAGRLREYAGDDVRPVRFAAGGVVITTAEGRPLRYVSGRIEGAVERLRAAAMPTPFPGLFLHSGLFSHFRFNARMRIAGDYDFLCQAWTRDDEGIRLPFRVAAMRTGGISSQIVSAAAHTRELFDAAEAHYGNIWTRERRRHYWRTRIISAAYAGFPAIAPKVHNAFRRLRGRPPLPGGTGSRRALPPFAPERVPIFIISYNRLKYLQRLIAWLQKHGQENIIIVDNASTYPPLLAYLDTLPYRVVRLRENLGHLAVWKCGLFADILEEQYFVVTDPDVVPCETCPDDAMACFYNHLMENPEITKCGFSLMIEDIPQDYPLRESVMEVETPYWKKRLPDGSGYLAPLDTTFALYRPGIAPEDPAWFSAVRLAPPYAARHLPWYEVAGDEDEESAFYQKRFLPQFSYWTAADADTLKQENLALRRRIEELEAQVDFLGQNMGNKIFNIIYRVLHAIKKRFLG